MRQVTAVVRYQTPETEPEHVEDSILKDVGSGVAMILFIVGMLTLLAGIGT